MGDLFIAHSGGGRPHSPLIHVEVKFRDGRVQRGGSAFLRWPWVEVENLEGYADDDDPADDILEWREVPTPPTKDAIIGGLLAALEAILKVRVEGWENIWAGSTRCQAIAREAIAKATGATQ